MYAKTSLRMSQLDGNIYAYLILKCTISKDSVYWKRDIQKKHNGSIIEIQNCRTNQSFTLTVNIANLRLIINIIQSISSSPFDMQDLHNSYSNPLQQIQMQPHLLNELTENYLEQLCSSTPGIARWETIQILMKQLSDDQTSIEQCLLLFNCLKVIINQTFASIDGLKDNKMYGWICMLYGVKCGILADKFQNKEIENSQDNSIWMENACYALLLSEMVIHMAQKSSKSGTSNRIFYPQFYRLISIILQKIASLEDLNLSAVVLPQNQNVTQIKSTNILQYLRQMRQQQNEQMPLKIKKSKQKSNKINTSKTCALIVSKITQLLLRSFALCKKKTIQKLNIVAELINVHLSSFRVEHQGQPNQATFPVVIDRYFEHFWVLQDQTGKQQQIDDENKMIEVKELTPRFIDEDAGFELKKLRIKKKKLIKKIESDAKTAKVRKLQQRKILNDVRNERSLKRHKKQMFVLEKQTQEAKKQHNKMKRIKQIRKGGKSGEKKSVKK